MSVLFLVAWNFVYTTTRSSVENENKNISNQITRAYFNAVELFLYRVDVIINLNPRNSQLLLARDPTNILPLYTFNARIAYTNPVLVLNFIQLFSHKTVIIRWFGWELVVPHVLMNFTTQNITMFVSYIIYLLHTMCVQRLRNVKCMEQMS